MNKKILKALASCAMACSVFFAGCGDDPDKLNQTWTVETAYIEAQAQGFTGTFEEFIQHLTNIADVKVNNQGQLIFTLGDGTIVNAGSVVGAKGDKGDTGEQGEQGLKGDKGDKGDQGEQGLKGDTGAQGEQGLKGDKGDTGAQGEKGDKGDTGAQGEKGDKGDTGATGAQGEKGDKGEQGEVGRVGFIVTSADQLEVAASVENSYIVLACDIDTNGAIEIDAVDHDLDFVLDLNGHTITNTSKSATDAVVSVRTRIGNTQYETNVRAIVKNGTMISNEVTADAYGMMARGNNIDLTIENIDATGCCGGLYTNGNGVNGVINIIDSKFVGYNNLNAGAYLAANYEYNFVNTEFVGEDGLYAKAGTYVFDNCTFIGNGEFKAAAHNGNGANETGAGLVIDSATGYISNPEMTYDIRSCTITSVNGYGLYEVVTAPVGYTGSSYLKSLEYDADTVITGKMANVVRSDNTITVSTVEQIEAAAQISGSKIVLLNNITTTDEITINATSHDLDFVLDLNGFTITNSTTNPLDAVIAVRTFIGSTHTGYKVKTTIENGKLISDQVSADAYGIMARGHNIEMNIVGVEATGCCGGFYTNGSGVNGIINMTNSKFIGYNNLNAAAYLAANYEYNFVNTEFVGEDGIYAKAGTHIYTNCTISGNGLFNEATHNGNGANETGAGLVIDSSRGYSSNPEMAFDINGCTITSVNGYGLYEVVTYPAGTTGNSYLGSLDIDNATVITGAVNDIYTETDLNA